MRRWSWVVPLTLATASIPICVTTVQADEKTERHEKEHEKTVKLEDVPAPAREALLREAGGDPILAVEKESAKGKVLYEAHVRRGDDVLGIRVDAKGKVIDRHSEKAEHDAK